MCVYTSFSFLNSFPSPIPSSLLSSSLSSFSSPSLCFLFVLFLNLCIPPPSLPPSSSPCPLLLLPSSLPPSSSLPLLPPPLPPSLPLSSPCPPPLQGADCELRCRWTSMNALHYAVFFDVPEIIETLLDHKPCERPQYTVYYEHGVYSSTV